MKTAEHRRIFITGDLHGEWDERKDFIKSLKESDILIVLGDLGWSWSLWHIDHFEVKCEVLSVLGNHENYSLISRMPVVNRYGGQMRQMKENVFYLLNGEMYEIGFKKFFVFGGALSIDKRWRTPYVSWWPEEQPTKDDYYRAIDTLKNHNFTFDYFLTHTAEANLVKTVLGRQDTIIDSTEDMIQALKYEINQADGSFKTHYFGHLHEFWKGEAKNYNWYCLYKQVADLDNNKVEFFD